METTVERKAKELHEKLVSEGEIDELNELTRDMRLSDFMREGSTVTGQHYGWQAGDNACALSAAVISMKARGYA
jgi:hypothetical protein